MSDLLKNVLLWVVIAVILMTVFQNLGGDRQATDTIAYSDFLQSVNSGQVDQVKFDGVEITGNRNGGQAFTTYSPETDYSSLIGELNRAKVNFERVPPENPSMLLSILISWFPFILLIGIWIFFMRQMQGGGGGRGAMSFGKSKARLLSEDQIKVTFADVAGVEEAKAEVSELVEFLRDPGKFQKLGGKIPRGVLMVGSPGTGKTLLAKAIAGEAKVPFFTISGSDFVEMFVGVGASRVRDMFEQAKKHSPCIIFIDEIDAVGRHRGAGLGGGHDEREQTLNQLLVEMDGFEGNEGVIVIAATNRPDVLDPALLRPGRFDRQVVVPLPDVRGREQILRVHMQKVPVADDVRPELIARGTPGFSGADLANLVNEAALFAARADQRQVDMGDFERAKDKIMMGAERKSMVMNDQEKKLTAYHEAGHAIVGRLVPEHDPVYKVSIIPRGRALGITMFLPEEDRYSHSKRKLQSQIATLYGGRIAEEIIFGADMVTTGASNDIERATEIARNMVTRWGLSDKLGPLAYSEEEGEVFLGRASSKQSPMSGETVKSIDEEIRKLVDDNYIAAEKILNDNQDILHAMADALLKYETIDLGQIDRLMDRREPGPPADWGGDDSSGKSAGKKASPLDKESDKKASDDSDEDVSDPADPSPSLH
ncbi:ATP-dependent zinc metalloprotease FtsH [Granulosicoccus antarcticus]|uniref:ATP-dependent zinc metalloprotease FtsH n=1 Tax=Granulosicoccus antarcticus IMCC3135 TaxID=1192854 RepID=A0A2Z2NM85_9GAMM|nr:ATP-dependent zinc metalloprotease FtsH [Granulosicoccus antarcticus]ASJ72299.1 ATP-dependent zinc metalloprotease FtsH [Granulosicoccus antarcticus IMCC3135]